MVFTFSPRELLSSCSHTVHKAPTLTFVYRQKAQQRRIWVMYPHGYCFHVHTLMYIVDWNEGN